MDMTPIELAFTTLASAFAGSYLAGYLRKKGENLATHEDIHKLVDQVSAVTKATKQIEAKISGDLWNAQKQWELKRDVLFEATKSIVEIDNALLGLDSLLRVDNANPELRHTTVLTWKKASERFDESSALVAIVCSEETSKALDELGALSNVIAGKLCQNNADVYGASKKGLWAALLRVRLAVRKELGRA
jgi:hypothetical protein